jgi:hypothetical protein
MATRTIGDGKTYATIAAAEAAAASGDTLELYWTTADITNGGAPGVYYNQGINVGNTNRTYTSIDDVLIFDYTAVAASCVSINTTGTITLNYIKAYGGGLRGITMTGAGTITCNGCIGYGSGDVGIRINMSTNNGTAYLYGCIGVSSVSHGISFTPGAATGVTARAYNCVGFSKSTNQGLSSVQNPYGAGTTFSVTNCYFYSASGTDATNTGTQATFTNCYSADGSAATTVCSLANAKFVDLEGIWHPYGFPNANIMSGSTLTAAGADPGTTISDINGTSKATGGANYDVGCSFISTTTAATQPTGVNCVNTTGNQWSVWWSALTNKEHPAIKVVAGGVTYYLYPKTSTAPGNYGASRSTNTNDYSRYLRDLENGCTFTLAGVTAISVAAANANESKSAYTTATVKTFTTAVTRPVFSGIEYFAAENTGLKFGWNNPSTNYTGIQIRLKANSTLTTNQLSSDTNLVATIESGVTNYVLVMDIDADWISNDTWYAALRAINVTASGYAVDTNVAILGPVTGPGGNFILQSSGGGTDVSGIESHLSNITTKLNTLLTSTASNGVLLRNAIQSNSLTLKTTTQSNSVVIRSNAVAVTGVRSAVQSNTVTLRAAIQSNSVTIRDYLEDLTDATESNGVHLKVAIQSNTKVGQSNGLLLKKAIGVMA